MQSRPGKKLLTATELARRKGVSPSYICRLCRLPKDDPRHIQNIKLHPQLYVIIDKKILEEFPDEYTAEVFKS